MKIDAHVHSAGISKCSRVTVEELIDRKKQAGYDGVILTNHCQSWYYPPEEHKNFMQETVNEYRRAEKYGNNVGFRVFFGLEVSLNIPAYNDWLLYCVTEKFLLSSPCLYKLSQKELFELCSANGVALVQAHPFRNSGWGIEEYMHGVEINCSPSDLEKTPEVLDIARKRGFLVTCGTDYHGDERPENGGIFLPCSLNTGEDVSRYLLSAKSTKLFLGDKQFEVPVIIKKRKNKPQS